MFARKSLIFPLVPVRNPERTSENQQLHLYYYAGFCRRIRRYQEILNGAFEVPSMHSDIKER